MKLTWHLSDGETPSVRERYPHGYWYAVTDDGGYDADGPDPLTTITRLVVVLEKARAAQ